MEDLIKSNASLSFLESEDVSEYAQTVGLKFEKIIKEFNLDDKLNPLMKDVIFLLEQIDLMMKEKNASQDNQQNLEIQLEQFKFEGKENKLERLRCQSQLEELEDAYRNENTELLNLISKLKEDNLKLRNLLNKNNFEEDEKQFKENIDDAGQCTESLLIDVKKKVKNLQKELDSKNENVDKLEKQLDQESKRVETLSKQIQKLKEENLILNQQINFKHNEYDKQLELIKELKNILSNIIRGHLDQIEIRHELHSVLPIQNNNYEINHGYIDKQKNHLDQLQLIQKLIETLSIAIETVKNTIDTSKFDKIKFQQNLNDKLKELENEQKQQSYRLSSSLNSTPIDSPKYCSLESNCTSLVNRSPAKKPQLNSEPQSKFSLNEIRNIILERNSLQSQIKFLEKQLFSFKKSTINKEEVKHTQFRGENLKLVVEAKEDKKSIENKQRKLNSPEPDCCPVQGPIPQDPKDHPNFRQKDSSSLLKFFPLLNRNR